MKLHELKILNHSLVEIRRNLYVCEKCNFEIFRISKNDYVSNNVYEMDNIPACESKMMDEALK